jgi:serine/threonine protein kinase/tetratricopeptide (TPR) repeat protein
MQPDIDDINNPSEDDRRSAVVRKLERVLDSRYEIHEEVGRGGMGLVFRAKDKHLQRDVALKIISPNRLYDCSYVDRFIEEAQISGQLQHPSIVPVYDIGKLDSGHLFFTMKLIKGETLANLLRKRASTSDSLDHWLGIFLQICQAVAFAHSKQVIHRDLKPSNVMVGRFGEVNVMDWGLAKIQSSNVNNRLRDQIATELAELSKIDPAGGNSQGIISVHPTIESMIRDDSDATSIESIHQQRYSIIQTIRHGMDAESQSCSLVPSEFDDRTQEGCVVGTTAYMPPEQASGQNEKVDFRSDVFSLGAILCEILTGSPPYVADTRADTLNMAISGSIENASLRIEQSQVHMDVKELAKDCLNPDQEKRPLSAVLLTKRLEEITSQTKERIRTAERENAATAARLEESARTYLAERRNQRTILLACVLAIGLIFVLIGGGGLLSHRESLRASQNRLTLEQFLAPASSLADELWNARVIPDSTEFARIALMKDDLERTISQMDIDPISKRSIDETLLRINELEKSRSIVLNLDQVYWDYNPYGGVYDPEKLLDGSVSDHDRKIGSNHQLRAYQRLFENTFWNEDSERDLRWSSLMLQPRWAVEEIDVGLMRFDHLCRNHLSLYGPSMEMQRLLDRIDSDVKAIRHNQSYEKQAFHSELWQAILESDVPAMMKLAEHPRIDDLPIPTRQSLSKALLDHGPEYFAETLQTQIEWILIESKEAADKVRARRTRDGSVIAFEVVKDLEAEDVLVVKLDTFHDFETGIGPGEMDSQLPTDDNRCLVDELSFARQTSDGSEFTDLEVTRVVSGHKLVPGREITNAVDYTSGTFWSLAHRPEQTVASSYFFVRPIRTVRYPIFSIRVDNGHPEYRQMTSLGKYRIFYANSIPELKDPIVVADQLIQRLASDSLLSPRVQMTVAEIASLGPNSDLNVAISTASAASRQSPGESWMSHLLLRLITRLPLDAKNAWLTRVQRDLGSQENRVEPESIRRKLNSYYTRLGDQFFDIWHQGSLAMYQQALDIDATGFKRFGRLGERLRRIGQVDEALAIMEKGIQLASEDSETWSYFGNMTYDDGDFVRSIALLERALQLDPNDIQSRRMLCRALFKEQSTTEGLTQFEFLRSHEQVDNFTLSLAVSSCLRVKKLDRALLLIDWWMNHQDVIVHPDKESKAPSYYDSHSSAWYRICLTAIDVAFSEPSQSLIDDDDQQLNAADTVISSIFEQMSSAPQLDWETVFAMIDRALYGREPVEPAETLENLQKFLIFLEKKVANTNRIRIRSAAIWMKSGQSANASTAIKHLPSDVSDPYSAFSDILKRIVDEQTGNAHQHDEFVFPSDRTRLLPERDRDLAEWLWWDRPKP